MKAFPKNTESCVDFGSRCAYQDFCLAWANPLQRMDIVPGGYRQEFWDPSVKEKEAKNVINL
jgi:hypothetical protein